MLTVLALVLASIVPADAVATKSIKTVCTPGYSAKHRKVTQAMRRAVYRRDKIVNTSAGVVDHRVPLSLGGSNKLDNLVWQPRAEAKAKDRDENDLHRLVCTGSISITEAHEIMWEWTPTPTRQGTK